MAIQILHAIVTCFAALIFAMPIMFPDAELTEYHAWR